MLGKTYNGPPVAVNVPTSLPAGEDVRGRFRVVEEPEAATAPHSASGRGKSASPGVPIRRNVVRRAAEPHDANGGMRRFTRLTNAFSKKVDNHKAAVALHFMHYNFARIHKSLRCGRIASLAHI
jgi:hypothetical protein